MESHLDQGDVSLRSTLCSEWNCIVHVVGKLLEDLVGPSLPQRSVVVVVVVEGSVGRVVLQIAVHELVVEQTVAFYVPCSEGGNR